MTVAELIHELKGNSSQRALSLLTGVSQKHISQMVNGKIGMGRGTLRKLIEKFPERKDQIVQVFLAQKKTNRAFRSPIGIEVSA